MNFALPPGLVILCPGEGVHVGKHFVDVLFVVTRQGERGPEFVVHALDNLSEILGYLLKES